MSSQNEVLDWHLKNLKSLSNDLSVLFLTKQWQPFFHSYFKNQKIHARKKMLNEHGEYPLIGLHHKVLLELISDCPVQIKFYERDKLNPQSLYDATL